MDSAGRIFCLTGQGFRLGGRVVSDGKTSFQSPDPVFSPREKPFSLIPKLFSLFEKGFSVVERGFSSREKGLSVPDKGFSVIEKGFSPTDKGFPPREKGLSVSDKGFSVIEKGFSLTEKGVSRREKGVGNGLKGQNPAKSQFSAIFDLGRPSGRLLAAGGQPSRHLHRPSDGRLGSFGQHERNLPFKLRWTGQINKFRTHFMKRDKPQNCGSLSC
jgi:hypothetical protein